VIDVAVASDHRYLPHAATCLRSVLVESSDPAGVRAHLLHGPELPDEGIDQLRQMVTELGSTLESYCLADELVDGLRVSDRFPAPNWYRAFLPDLLPESPRVLYLDCDVVALDDVATLVTMDLDGCAIAAVDNISLGQADNLERTGLTEREGYFNCGVLLLDLDRWRQDDVGAAVVAEGRARPDAPFPDQDALNVVLAQRRYHLHPRWNCSNSLVYLPTAADDLFGADAVQEALRHPGLVHFEGMQVDKPWHYLSKHPYRSAYLEHRSHTPWPSDVIEERTLLNRLLRPLPRRVVNRVLRERWRMRRRFHRTR
jgi:lipopolysaccharide biosynthesis glycosyltransferase